MTFKIQAAQRLAITAARAKKQSSKSAHDAIFPAVFGTMPAASDIETNVEGMEITVRRNAKQVGAELESNVKQNCDKIKTRVEGNERYIEGVYYDGASESEWNISVFTVMEGRGHVIVSLKRKDGMGTTRYEDDSEE